MANQLPDVNHIHPLVNFIEEGKDFLPSDFLRDKPNFMTFLEIYLKRFKDLDDMWVSLAEGRLLANATGLNLDEIGQQVGVYRNGLEDQAYRAVITILTGGANKHGTRPEFIGTLKQLFGADNFATYKGDNYRFDINIFDSCFDIFTIIPELLDMLPLVTHLRITESNGIPFGFNGSKESVGFGTVHSQLQRGIGGLATERYVSDYDQQVS